MRSSSEPSNRVLRGFTLIELLVAIGILTLIIGVGLTIFTSITSQFDKADAITNLQREGGRMMEQISRAVKNSTAVGGTTTQLSVTVPASSDNLEYAENGECTSVSFTVDTATLFTIRKESSGCKKTAVCGTGADACSLNNIQNARVVDGSFLVISGGGVAPDRVKVKFTLEQSSEDPDQSQKASVVFEKTILTRGY